MGIVEDDIRAVRDAIDIVALINEHVTLKKVGTAWKGLCPFHAEKSPSFSVNAQKGLWHCFGCQAAGDAISFVREIDHVDFASAVERLAAKANIEIRSDASGEHSTPRRRKDLVELVEFAAGWYHERLLEEPAAATYLADRGLGRDDVATFQIGWAQPGNHLVGVLDAPRQDLLDSGLVYPHSDGSLRDHFYNRIMFPIRDPSGNAVGFGGRILPDGRGPKYKNSPESVLYQKSRVLYGLDKAKAAAVKADTIVVCEGYTDVIGFAHAGIPNAVATCGTALTEQHARLLRRFARRVVLCFDADHAGTEATGRFFEWEQSLGIEVGVATLPPGADPGELGFSDPRSLHRATTATRTLLRARVDAVLAAADSTSAEAKARSAHAALDIVDAYPSEVVRAEYVTVVAAALNIDRHALARDRATRHATSATPDHVARPAVARVASSDDRPLATAETEALRTLILAPEQIVHALDEWMFTDPVALAAYRALRDGGVDNALAGDDRAVVGIITRLAVDETPVPCGYDAYISILRVSASRALRQLRDTAVGSADPMDYQAEIGALLVLTDRAEATGAPANELAELHHTLRRHFEQRSVLDSGPAAAPPAAVDLGW